MPIDKEQRSGLYAASAADALALLEVDPRVGLTSQAADARLSVYGENRLDRVDRVSWFALLLDQLRSVIVWLLGAAVVLSLLVGDIPEAIAIVVVLLINTAIGFFTSWNAVRSMEALFQLTADTARVRRDGHSVLVPVGSVTVGDLVVLEAGDIVPADLRLIHAHDLHCDESALTGESAPVEKTEEHLPPDTVVPDRTNLAFKGTGVTRGEGLGMVATIGSETEIGRVATLAQTAKSTAFPLEKRLDKLGQVLVLITVVLSVLIAVAGLARGLEPLAMIETAIALAVAAVPEGLPVVATLALARGMLRLARRNTLIERLSAVETLGATTLVLTDKTGTLTENRMTVAGFLLADDTIRARDLPGLGTTAIGPNLRLAVEIGALCNSAELSPDVSENADDGVGDPLELALLHFANQLDLRPDLDAEDRPEIAKVPYDPDTKMMATSHAMAGGVFTAVKGAPEAVLEVCGHVMMGTGAQDLTPALRAGWLARLDASASAGYRLIGLACKETPTDTDVPYDGLTLVGFVTLLDPLRPDVPGALAECIGAGVRVIMMTGDHVATATEIADQAGLGVQGRLVAMTEHDLQGLGTDPVSDELRHQLSDADVFARVAPETKLQLVDYFQREGHIVAMTGDGVNDAPALKKSDIGIAMGQRGTQVARDAADVVLKDDAFTSIIAAMWQGRVIFGNIRRFVVYLMSCNFSEILVIGIAIAAGLPAPLIPLQILFLNIVTDVFPAFALGLGEGDRSIMRRPPRDPKEPIIGRGEWIDIVVFGVLVTVATLGAFWIALRFLALTPAESATVAFLTLALSQLWHVFNMRDQTEGMFKNSVSQNPYVYAAVFVSLALLAAAFLMPALSGVLAVTPPSGMQLALSCTASLFPLLFGQIWLTLANHARNQ